MFVFCAQLKKRAKKMQNNEDGENDFLAKYYNSNFESMASPLVKTTYDEEQLEQDALRDAEQEEANEEEEVDEEPVSEGSFTLSAIKNRFAKDEQQPILRVEDVPPDVQVCKKN